MSSYSNNQHPLSAGAEEEIDLKEVFSAVFKYKKSMIVVTLLITLISGVLAYFKTNVYQANLTLQIQDSSGAKTSGDFMETALGMQGGNLGNEIAIFKSRFIAKKVLEKINIGTRYYTTHHFRSVELYKNSPFTVNADAIVERLISQEFHVEPVDAAHYRLSFEIDAQENNPNQPAVRYSAVHRYGVMLNHPLFRLALNQVGPMSAGEYTFTITPNEQMFAQIQSSLSIATSEEKGSILILGYQDNVPQRAQDILNAIADAYSEQSVRTKSTSAEKTLGFIDEQLEAINKALQKSANNLKNYKSSHIVIDLGSKASIASQKLSEYESQLYELEMQESTLRNLLSHLRANKEMSGIDLGPVSGNTAMISSLIGNIQEANTLRSSLVVDFTEKHPSVMKVNEQLKALKANLEGTIESSLRSIDHRKSSLERIITQHSDSLESLPEEEKQLTQLNRNFMVNEKIYEYLLQKRAETAIIESSTVSGIRVIDDALVNGAPAQPNRVLIVMMGFIIGLILGIVQAFFRNLLANTIQSIHDIEARTNMPLYSVLPLFKEKKSLYEDALRVLLTKLEFGETRPKIIAITSSVQGEGRTTTALEFAKIIGESGKKVIVLDLDIRGSRVNKKLSIANDAGISTYLAGKNTLEEVVKSLTPHVDVVGAGPVPANPYELIMSDVLKNTLTQLRGRYDYIILESPPVGLVADALVLMRLSELSLVVFKAAYSKKDYLKSMNRFVEEHNLDNVGIILNALELKKIRPWLRK